MRIYLTGGTGYIGGALARRLAGSGHEVRALVRPTSDSAGLRELGIACFEGDIADRYSLREGMSGADWVVHAAAELDFERPLDQMRRVNVEGTANVASLAYKLGVGRMLAISSIARWGGSPSDGSPATEESPLQKPLPSNYSRTKYEGEQAARQLAEQGLRLNVVYPSLVYGPPGKKQGANAVLRSVLKRRLPAIVGGDRRTSWIHIDDLVEGVVRLMELAEPGRDYLLTGDEATIADVVRRVGSLADLRPPRLSLPIGLAGLLLALARPYYRLRGFRPPVSPEQLSTVARHWNFDDSRARREFDWRPRTLDEGLPPTIEYLRRT